MPERERRVAENESLFRKVNEEIEALDSKLAEISDHMLHIVCECGALSCVQQIAVPVAEYERIRADSTLFFVLPGHDDPGVEDVVGETARYLVVRKSGAIGKRIVEQTDPR